MFVPLGYWCDLLDYVYIEWEWTGLLALNTLLLTWIRTFNRTFVNALKSVPGNEEHAHERSHRLAARFNLVISSPIELSSDQWTKATCCLVTLLEYKDILYSHVCGRQTL